MTPDDGDQTRNTYKNPHLLRVDVVVHWRRDKPPHTPFRKTEFLSSIWLRFLSEPSVSSFSLGLPRTWVLSYWTSLTASGVHPTPHYQFSVGTITLRAHTRVIGSTDTCCVYKNCHRCSELSIHITRKSTILELSFYPRTEFIFLVLSTDCLDFTRVPTLSRDTPSVESVLRSTNIWYSVEQLLFTLYEYESCRYERT